MMKAVETTIVKISHKEFLCSSFYHGSELDRNLRIFVDAEDGSKN